MILKMQYDDKKYQDLLSLVDEHVTLIREYTIKGYLRMGSALEFYVEINNDAGYITDQTHIWFNFNQIDGIDNNTIYLLGKY